MDAAPTIFFFLPQILEKASDSPPWKYFALTNVHYLEEKGGRQTLAALSDPMFNCLLTQTANQPIARQQLDARGRARNDLLKSPPSFRTGKRGDLIEFGCWCQMGRSTGTLTRHHRLWGLQRNGPKKRKYPVNEQPLGGRCLEDVRGQTGWTPVGRPLFNHFEEERAATLSRTWYSNGVVFQLHICLHSTVRVCSRFLSNGKFYPAAVTSWSPWGDLQSSLRCLCRHLTISSID